MKVPYFPIGVFQMTCLRRIGFVFSFAWRGVWNRPALRMTLVNLATVTGVVALCVVAYGITRGNEAVQNAELESDPLNRSLWSGSNVRDVGITDESVKRLAGQLKERFGSKTDAACHPFSETEFIWIHKDGRSVHRYPGRTILPDDPMLQSRPLSRGRRDFLDAATPGIIAAPGLLESLGYSSDSPPDQVEIETPRGGRIQVKVLDTTRQSLPLDHMFVVADKEDLRLRSEQPDPELREIRTQPLPESWPSDDALPESVVKLIRDFHILPPIEESKEVEGKVVRRWWLLSHDGAGPIPSASDWRTYLKQIATHMESTAGRSTDRRRLDALLASFCQPVFESDSQILPRARHDYVGVYVKDSNHLPIVEQELEKLGWPLPDPEILRRYMTIAGQTGKTLRTLMLVGGLVALVALWNMAVIQFLWNEQKRAATGMLKAMGMGNGTLATLAVAEGSVIWACAILPAMALGIFAGSLVAVYRFGAGTKEAALGFHWDGTFLALVAVASWLMCAVSSHLAGAKARAESPCESLRT